MRIQLPPDLKSERSLWRYLNREIFEFYTDEGFRWPPTSTMLSGLRFLPDRTDSK